MASGNFKGAKVLMVGAGGIGCELLKTLALSGFEDIHIIDMDTIEVSNLNRQFLFRQCHVGQSKAKVARDAVLKFRPHINITPYHANVKNPEFNVDFFKQFNVVLNGLDNLDARRHVNRLCLAAEVPLVESGTTGFLGQVTVHIKGKTECYECQPKPTPKTYPVCTITNTPSKFVHCIVWAKDLLFGKLFGDRNQDNDLNVRSSDVDDSSKHTENVFERITDEDPEQYGRRVFDHVFGYNIQVALANEETWKNRNKPRPIYVKDFLPEKLIQQNGNMEKDCMKQESTVSAMSSLGLINSQDVWNLVDNIRIFLESLRLFLEKREKDVGSLIFDKDDQLAVELVTAAANIRASSFGIPLHSLFEAKGIAGNIVHAVATTNAIVAGLLVVEAIKVLRGDYDNCRMTYCLEHPSRKLLLMPVEPFEPNKSCYVCSKKPLLLEVNTHTTKLRDFVEKIVKKQLGMNLPMIMHGGFIIFEEGDDLEEDEAANYALKLDKVLAELPAPIVSGTVLTVDDLQQEMSCEVHIKHREEFDEENVDEMVLSGWKVRTEEDKPGPSNGESTSETGNVHPIKKGKLSDGNESGEFEIAAAKPEVVSSTKQKCSEADRNQGSEELSGKKQELDEVEIAAGNPEEASGKKRKPLENHGLLEDNDDEVVLLDENPGTVKKKRVQ